MPTEAPTLGLILAGGLARRMGGGDKPRTSIGGVTILSRVLERMKPQCTRLILNANGDPARFAVAALAGAAGNMPEIASVARVPGACPFLPRDLVARLDRARAESGQPLACA